jgi:hypothetical protein
MLNGLQYYVLQYGVKRQRIIVHKNGYKLLTCALPEVLSHRVCADRRTHVTGMSCVDVGAAEAATERDSPASRVKLLQYK